jgi:L-alanine-DL-glutamate epimerase-like enolase superfamily enzyme
MRNPNRREFLSRAAVATLLPVPIAASAAVVTPAPAPAEHLYHGRLPAYREWRPIEPGRIIQRIESFTRGSIGMVRITTTDGAEGWGMMSNYDVDITAQVLHRKLAGLFLGRDAGDIDTLVDRAIEANYKFPWSYICRALTGIETALWDLYGRVRGKPVCELLGGQPRPVRAYGSSMRRDISPEAEADRLARLRDTHGFTAFKIRIGQVNGHDVDAAPGRTERLVPAVRRALGDRIALGADANSGYTPPRAIEVGRMLEQHGVEFLEEPCPYWELEWTAEVAAALKVHVAGGEQDNDLAQWRRMLRTGTVDIAQPDIAYLGGMVRALRVAQMAARHGQPVVPHSANLSLVTVFSLHLLASIPNAGPFVEFTIEEGEGVNREARELYSPFLEVRDGWVTLPPGPGWGVAIHPEWLASAQHTRSER